MNRLDVDRDNILPFRQNESTEYMGRKKTAIQEQPEQPERTEPESGRAVPELDKKPERRSIVLPAYIWRVLENEAEDQLRTLSRQIEAVMINYYQLGTHKIESIDKTAPGNFGWISHEVVKAS